MNFINLHNHTQFSFLDGYGTPQQVSDRLKEIGQDSIALTDHGNIYSHAPFNKVFKKTGQHLVFGCEMYVVGEIKPERGYNHITVLAKTQEGYQNLLWLVNQSYKQFYYKPRVTLTQIIEHSKGLVVLSGCSLDSILIKNKGEDQEKFFGQVVKLFKNMEWYVEIQPFKDEQVKWDFLVKMAHKHKVPCVITADCHYPSEQYKKTQDFMLAINTNKPMSDPDRLKMEYDLFIPSADTIWERATAMGMSGKEASETMQRSYDIAHSCTAELPMTGLVVVGYGFDKLRYMCFEGLKKRHLHVLENYVKRLEYELNLIKEKKFEDYFFIIADLMKWAKARMLCGAGRGSSAGSLACYCLEITEVDPIKHGLMYERFIDINRKDLPDIDLDFPSDRREEVIAYLSNKYGKENTAQLINFNAYKPKAIIMDAGRILGIPAWEIKDAGSQIIDRSGGDARANFCLRDSLSQFEKLGNLFIKYPKLMDAIDLEGQVRQVGKHAAAVVISRDKLATIGAINQDGVFSLDKYTCEPHGLLKIDVLGIETLSVLADVCAEVGMDFHDLYTLPLDDDLTFSTVFTPSKLIGIFQFEGLAARQVCRDIVPKNFEHLVHITALARPGTLNSGTTPEYIRRIRGSSQYDKRNTDFESTDPALMVYTGETLGLVLFQEQVMQVVKNIGKFGWASTSAIRVAMSKSLGEEHFNKYKADFIKGAAEDKIDEDRALNIWKQCYTHGSWSFNKCLSWSTPLWLASKGNNMKGTITIEALYEMYFGEEVSPWCKQRVRKGVIAQIWSKEGEKFKIHNIKAVYKNGKRDCWRYSFSDSSYVDCTPDHRFIIDSKWQVAAKAKVGSLWATGESITYTKKTVKGNAARGRHWNIKNGDRCGKANPSFINGATLALSEFKKGHAGDPCETCGDVSSRMEAHHNDLAHGSASPKDLSWLCVSCHKKEHYAHGRTKRGERGLQQGTKELVSMQYLGQIDTYDLEMAKAPHNFLLSNGLVTHNSHAVSYSYLSYWCGYMKAHYPAQYYARILKDKTDEADIKPVLKEWGKEVIPLDINLSNKYFSAIDNNTLVGGFVNIAGIGESAADKIIAAQPFESLADFKSRMAKGIATKVIDAITKGQEWANTQTLEDKFKAELDSMTLSAPLTTCEVMLAEKVKTGIILAKVVGTNLRNSNDPEKVQKRGKKIQGYPEYVILTIKDDSDNIWRVYCPHKLTERFKQDLLNLNNKVVLFKLKIEGDAGGGQQGGIPTCEKFKVLN